MWGCISLEKNVCFKMVSAYYRGAVLWNSLSVEAKQATSLNYFLDLIN